MSAWPSTRSRRVLAALLRICEHALPANHAFDQARFARCSPPAIYAVIRTTEQSYGRGLVSALGWPLWLAAAVGARAR